MEKENTLKFMVPSGHTVVIREQNGDDDDVLSNGADIQNGSSYVKFIAGIIIESTYSKMPLTPQEVGLIRLPDLYCILLHSRIFSIGQELSFEYNWPDIKEPVPYTEDLGQFIWDYEKEFPSKPSDENYFEFRIAPTSKDLTRTIKLSSGKELEYTYMNAHGEKYLMTLPANKVSKNQEIFARKLRQKTDSGWMDVNSFRYFSTTDMAELRKDMREHDPVLEIFSEIQHPEKPEKTIFFPILATMDFFFPRQIS